MKKAGPLIGITLDRDGEYLKLKHAYTSAITGAGGTAVLVPEENDPLGVASLIDGLLIPGGGDLDPVLFSEAPHPASRIVPRERTDFEIALLKAIIELRKPVFGICYGMQLINVMLGGSLYQDIASQLSGAVDHRKGLHRVRGEGTLIKGEELVNTSHHQAVNRLGTGVEALAYSDDGLVEAIRLRDYPLLVAVQWHPERSTDSLSASLFRSFVEASR